ncbi:MAG: PQQ-binding-like beta-propeller repeat protein [Pirellulales bacterium]|nr:PQQ-binding-like beta-propeller repeat protein [Pirellulales bacterium]
MLQHRPMVWCWMAAVMAILAARAGAEENPFDADAVLERLDSPRGICVLLADAPAEPAAALAARSELTIHVQHPDRQVVESARASLDKLGLLGTRVFVEEGPWAPIHLADQLADAVVVLPERVADASTHKAELLRAIRPLGKLILASEEVVKPYPSEADDWTHPYRRPNNNTQSSDQLARAPYLTQFLAEPFYVPFPEVTVTSAGRVFKAFGHVGFKKRDWPWLNTLVAFNGYNGTLLWKRPLEEGFNIHRNTMVATPDVLYVADSRSCKLIDTATGEVKDEIVAPKEADGPVWKWMALDDGVLYAVVGGEELRDATLRGASTHAGWPWQPMTPGYDRPDYPWGFGRTMFAMDLATREVRWLHTEKEPIDARAVAMRGGRIYFYSHPNWLACREAATGKEIWRTADSELLKAIGPHDRAQLYNKGFSSQTYLMCGEGALYFAGPQRTRLVAASTEDGRLLWQHPDGNLQLVLRDEGLFALGRTGPSKLFEPLTGRVLADLPVPRGNCTRATGTADSIFARAYENSGTLRLTLPDRHPERIALMRPDCHDGVIVAGGMLYFGPWMCDCSLSLVGIICLGPAGDFRFHRDAVEEERLETFAAADEPLAPLETAPGDWPTYRADNRRRASSPVAIRSEVATAWQYVPPSPRDAAAPVTAGGMVFLSGSDGAIRAVDAASGAPCWTVHTGGPIAFPPSVSEGRLFIGSGDGNVYAFEASSGKPLWRFRVAPQERKIPVYGRLVSTWPVASGVLAEGDTVYAAAGIASYDGTHVVALDAASGRIHWQNNRSGCLDDDQRASGVSVQGHLLLHKGQLYLAGGNVASPAVYDLDDGRCLTQLGPEWHHKAPRGRELFVVNDRVVAFDRLLYAPKDYWAGRYFCRRLVQADSEAAVIRGVDDRLFRIVADPDPAKKPRIAWVSTHFAEPLALALGENALVVAGTVSESRYAVAALALDDGRVLWRHDLPDRPIQWGLALDAQGRVFVALDDGRYVALAGRNREDLPRRHGEHGG